MSDGYNIPLQLAETIADRIVELGLAAKRPDVTFLPEYDTTSERGIKVAVIPSNVMADSKFARDIVRQVFSTQVSIMKYLPDCNASEANDAVDLAERLTALFTNADLYVDGSRFNVNAVVMYGASEVLWNGDYQIDGLLKNETLAPSDVFSTSFVVVATRYVYTG